VTQQQYPNYLPDGTIPEYSAYGPLQRRTPQETALGYLFNQGGGPSNIAPGMVGQLRDRATQAADLYGVGAALGAYGAPGYGANDFTRGGNDVQQLIRQAVQAALGAGSRGGVQSQGSFRDYINSAQTAFRGLNPTSGQYSDLAESLGFTNAEDTAGAYGGFVNRFLAPRVDQARGPMRNVLARQLDERQRNYFENPATQIIGEGNGTGPADFLRYITQGF